MNKLLIILLFSFFNFQKNDFIENDFIENDFDILIKKNKGKVIYVDIWASWCAPCRKEIKQTKKISEKYKNKDLIIVFLSIDEDLQQWEKASKKEDIYKSENNINLIGSNKSVTLKDVKISSIPRYIIIDKNGNLVNSYAPSPSDKRKLEYELNKYLSE